MKEKIIQTIREVVGKDVKFVVERPKDERYGDWATNAAIAAKIKPEKIIEKIKNIKNIEKIEIKNNFINISIKNEWFGRQLSEVLKMGSKYGKSDQLQGKKIMVEFAHPNTHKQFHIGHLRNICIGESLSRILQANGAKVIRTNYQGDVGLHIAKALYGLKLVKAEKDKIAMLGKAYAAGAKAYEEDKKAKAEIIEINKHIYLQDDGKINKLWQETRQWSLDYFASIYKRLDTRYDRLYFESEVHKRGAEVVQEALKKGILKESDGAIVFDGSQYGLHTRVFLTKEGVPTYEAKELGLAELEFSEFGEIDKLIHVVAPEQTSFFEVTFKVEELLDPKKYKGKQYHLKYGFVDLKEGKMSSRLGKVVSGESVLNEVKQKTKNEQLAVSAVKYFMLKHGIYSNIRFDVDESVRVDGNSGVYLQYTHARAKSVLRKVGSYKLQATSYKLNSEELAVLRQMSKFEEVVSEARREYAPHKVCGFLYELSQRFNTFYQKHTIKDDQFRLALTAGVAQVLKNGLELLGIEAVEKM